MGARRIRKIEKKLWDEDFEKIRLTRSKKRAIVVCTIVFFCFFIVFIRLFVLMVFEHEVLSQKAERQYRRIKTLKAQRGRIWDREMRPMALDIESDSLYAAPSRIKDMKGLASKLSPVIDMSVGRIIEKFLAKKDKDFIWLIREMNEETARGINKLKDDLKLKEEIGILTETKRYYPNAQRASHIIGYTDIDDEGLDGIELEYNDYIKGKVKRIQLSKDARGYSLSKDIEDAVPGNNLLLTIDGTLQNIVEREMENAVMMWKAEAAVAIMMNPMTGEILAMANSPTYDSNFAGKVEVDRRRNRAITDLYEPGSTFKVILAAAAVEEGIVRLDEKFDASKGFIKVPGGVIHEAHKHNILTFKEVIQKSSNIGSVQVGLRLGEKRFYQYIKKFGFGEKTGIDLPGEVRGLLKNPKSWSGRSLASISIGQEIAVTPLQILRAYSAIANGGKLMKPYVVSEIISPSGEVVKSISPAIERRVMSEETARIMRDILKTVVEEGGTAQKASVIGNLVAGKTGTAQMVDPETRRYSKNDYVSSFVGFVPADNPRIALIVVVYKPRGERYGGVVAAPVFKNIIEHTLVYLDIPIEREENYVFLVSNSR
jgi:cell division protein FtsI (penicillin-binding protein 3)